MRKNEKRGNVNEELPQEYADILEALNWSVVGYTSDGRVELQTCSPAGEDFCVCVEVQNFPEAIAEYAAGFDPDEHASMWIETKRNGTRGIPGVRELVHDAEDIDRILQELASALREADEAMGLPDCDEAAESAILANAELLAERQKPMDKDCFRQWIYDNYNVPADNCTLAPDMLEGILDYAGGLDGEQRFNLFRTVFPSIPEEIIRRADY